MEVEKVLCMNGGDGEASYANNSLLQKKVILEVKPMLEESITELYCNTLPECLKMADLGCSTGPNTLMPLRTIIECITETSRRLGSEPPMFQVFLNDLPQNDFNSIFKSLVKFYKKLEDEKEDLSGKCFIAGMPGSFYRRLFPDHSIHFVHSSYSLHWLSQVPKGLVSKSGYPLNNGNIYITRTSPPEVHQAYFSQFEKDFTMFLKLRSQEIIPGGRMLITLLGNEDDKHDSTTPRHFCNMWELISTTISDMITEGLIQEWELDSFNIPLYMPSAEEVRSVVQRESSFTLLCLKTFKLDWDANIDDGNKTLVSNKYGRAKYIMKRIRAVGESILASHFGDAIIDSLFHRFSNKVAENIDMGKGIITSLVISLSRKEKI